MRLLLVTTDFPPEVGGTQTYASELAIRFHYHVERFAVVAPSTADCEAHDHALPFPVVRVSGSENAFAIRARSHVSRLIREDKYSAVFCVSWAAAIPVLRSRIPVTVFCAAHGRELLFTPSRFYPVTQAYTALRSWTLTRVRGFFPVSRFTAGLLRDSGVDPERIHVVGNGTDPDRFYPEKPVDPSLPLNPEDQPVILSIARLVPRKGMDTLIAAMPDVLRRVPNTHLLLGGSGPDRVRLERLIDQFNVADHVQFIGSIPYEKLRSFYNLCDVFVLPARAEGPDVEGFGIVFLEAGACGKPVIGARTGGIPDAVLENQTGLLVEPDQPAKLALAISRVLLDAELRESLGHAGRAYVLGTANWDAVADRLLKHMRGLM